MINPYEVFSDVMDGGKPLSEVTTTELETLKMYLGTVLTTIESELGERYQQPMDIAGE